MTTWPPRVALLAMMTWLPMRQSCATWVATMKRLSSPTSVRLPPPSVPGFIVTCSRIWLRAPMASALSSPRYFRSCGIWPSEAKGKTVVASPIEVRPATATWLCSVTRGPSTTRGPITHQGPMRQPSPISAPLSTTAVRWTSAVGWIGMRSALRAGFFPGEDHRRELRFRAEGVADPRLAAELPYLAAAALHLDVQLERVAGLHDPAELRGIDAH